MVKAWYMDDDPSDQRNEHHKNPPEFLLMDQVFERSGVEYFQLNAQTFETDGELEKIKKARGYTYEDEITCSEKCLANYAEKLKTFYTEHLHTDEEIRLVVEGSGYFDVRDKFDKWIRIQVLPGDLIVLPAGIYHRFTMDNDNFIRARRFFIGEPVWTAHNRQDGADEIEARQEYIDNFVRTK